jgi:Zn-dependent peptidase ImmA (M78 family)
MTQSVELSDLLAETIPEINGENPSEAYKAKLVTVRRLQSKGMTDAAIEKALNLTIQAADRVVVEFGDSANLLFRVRWDHPTRLGAEARNVQGDLQILIRGEIIRARGQVPPSSWRFQAEPTLELLSRNWPNLVLETDTSSNYEAGKDIAGVNFTSVLKAHANRRRLTIRVARTGNFVSFFSSGQQWRVDFATAISAFEKFGQLLYERLASSSAAAQTWTTREDLQPKEALALAVGKPRPILLKHLESRLRSCGQKFDLASLAHNIPEIVVAARMAPSYLSDSDIIQLLKWVSEVPSHSINPSVTEASTAAQKWLDSHFDSTWKEFDEGYELASWFRRYRQIKNDTDALDVDRIISDWNVGVISREYASSLDAIAVWGKTHGPTIILNAKGVHAHSSGGRRATLAHEICHILLDRKSALPILEVLGGRVPKGIESRARAFAAELLLPRTAADRVVRESYSVQAAVDKLADQYRVSASLAAWQITNSKAHLTAAERTWLKSLAYGPVGKTNAAYVFEPVP